MSPFIMSSTNESIATEGTAALIRMQPLMPTQIDSELLPRWRALLERSCTANCFHSPDYVLPYQAACPPARTPWLLTGEDRETGELLGLGLFETTRATKTLPLPHLRALTWNHLYRDGMLVHRDRQDDFFTGLLHYLTEEQESWIGLEFQRLTLEAPWAQRLRERAVEFGCSFRLTPHHQAPAVHLAELGEGSLEQRWSASRRKSWRRNRNRLEKLGPVEFRLLSTPQEVQQGVEHFLQLEHASWKGKQGTSLLSTSQDTQFAREMTQALAHSGNALLSELRVGNEVAACAINMRAGDQLLAFKIGWNERFAEASPGMLHEVELIRTLRKDHPGLRWADSCAQQDSYLKGLWPDSLTVGTGLLSVSTLARGTGKLIAELRRLKQRACRGWFGQELPSDC